MIRFRPLRAGAVSTATLSATSGTAMAATRLSGRAFPELRTSGPDFGPIDVGTTSPPVTYTLATGAAGAQVRTVWVEGGPFHVVVDGCTGVTVPPHGSCDVDVTFGPIGAGPALAVLHVDTLDGIDVAAELRGEGR